MTREEMNIHQKLLKIADLAGVLQKNKSGFNYKYVTEEEIQAKITAGMQKYGVMLYPSIIPETLTVEPYHYEKPKTKKSKDEKGKDVVVDYLIPVNEVIVKSAVKYTWVNVDNPAQTVECFWAYIGQMEDASQAFGAGTTYGNRYYLMKALQLATTEADPDNYRTKQKEAESYEETKEKKKKAEELALAINEVVAAGTTLMKSGISKDEVMAIVGKHNDENPNPASIKSLEVCKAITDDFNNLLTARKNKKTNTKTKIASLATKGEINDLQQ